MPRPRPLPGDLRAPRLALARLMLKYVTVLHEQARGPVQEALDDPPHTVSLSWRSTGQAPGRRASTSTVHLQLRFRAGTLTIAHSSIRTQAGRYVGTVNAGPEYQQNMAHLSQGLATQLWEAGVLTRTLNRMGTDATIVAERPRVRL